MAAAQCNGDRPKLPEHVDAKPGQVLQGVGEIRGVPPLEVLPGLGRHDLEERGLHLFPFQVPLPGLSTWCDRHLQSLRGLMINICVLACKQP